MSWLQGSPWRARPAIRSSGYDAVTGKLNRELDEEALADFNDDGEEPELHAVAFWSFK